MFGMISLSMLFLVLSSFPTLSSSYPDVSESDRRKLSYVGRNILRELEQEELGNGNRSTGPTSRSSVGRGVSLPWEGRGNSWNVDFEATTDKDWITFTPNNHFDSDSPLLIPRSCYDNSKDCDADFRLPICSSSSDDSKCQRWDVGCNAECMKWRYDNPDACTDWDRQGHHRRHHPKHDLNLHHQPSIFSTVEGFACVSHCCNRTLGAQSHSDDNINKIISRNSSQDELSFDLLSTIPSPKCQLLKSTQSHPLQPPKSLCVGHSHTMVDTIYNLLLTANHFIDISSLDSPDGQFLAAIRNAITRLYHHHFDLYTRTFSLNNQDRDEYADAHIEAGMNTEVDLDKITPKIIHIRVLLGAYGYSRNVNSIQQSLLRDIPAHVKNSPIRIHLTVGYWILATPYYDLNNIIHHRYLVNEGTGMSFNHAKIIAVDGKTVFTGGHNLRTGNVLTSSPILDLSVTIRGGTGHGGVARSAHEFLDIQWRKICQLGVLEGEDDHDGEYDENKNRSFILSSLRSRWKSIYGKLKDLIWADSLWKGDFSTNSIASTSDAARFRGKVCPPEFRAIHTISAMNVERNNGVSSQIKNTVNATSKGKKIKNDEEQATEPHTEFFPVFTIGRYGGISTPVPKQLDNHQTSDLAIVSMFDSAKYSIKLAQQDLGPPGGFQFKQQQRNRYQYTQQYLGNNDDIIQYWDRFGSSWVLESICHALLRGVTIQVVVSDVKDEGMSAPEENYANGWTADDIMYMVVWYMEKITTTNIKFSPKYSNVNFSMKISRAEVLNLVCDKFQITTVRYNAKQRKLSSPFPSTNAEWSFEERCPSRYEENAKRNSYDCDSEEAKLFGIHSKMIIIDDRASYVGSQNLYSTPLAEWGVIWDHERPTKDLLEQFWNPLWEASYSNHSIGIRKRKLCCSRLT